MASTLNPCYFNSVASLALLVTAITIAWLEIKRITTLYSRSAAYLLHAPSWAVHVIQITCASVLFACHVFALFGVVFMVSATSIPPPAYSIPIPTPVSQPDLFLFLLSVNLQGKPVPYLVFSESALLATWLLLVVSDNTTQGCIATL